jgi:Hint domain
LYQSDAPKPGEDGPATASARAGRPPRESMDRDWTLPGLCWNAYVMTSFGALPVQVLRKHDPLRLADGSVARIAWVDKIHLDEAFLAAYPDAQPVLIRAGALGPGQPTQDILVSPEQKIAVQSTDYAHPLRLARELLDRPGILRQPQTILTYYLFHCGQPARVMVAGAQVYTAP